MGENSNNNRREELYTKGQLNSGMSAIQSALSAKYDVYTSSQVQNSAIIEDKFRNAVGVSLTAKQDVYGNRFYGEGSGDYRIANTGNGYEVLEETNLKFGSVKTDEKEVVEEKTFFLFRKGSMKGLDGSFKKFCHSAEEYYVKKSIAGAKKPLSNGIFNFYYALVILSLISVVTFFGFMLYSLIISIKSSSSSILAVCFGGAKTVWIIWGASVLITVIGAIVHSKKIKPVRPTGKGMSHTNYSLHCLIMAGLQLLTIAFSALLMMDNFFGYTVGYLFYPFELACLVYPVAIFILLVKDKYTFNKEYVEYSADQLTEEQFNELQNIEQDIKRAAVKPDTLYVNDIALSCVAYDVKVSVWRK